MKQQLLKGQALNRARPKSSYRSRAGRHFFGTENMIWAGLGPIGNTEKKVWADYEQLLRPNLKFSWIKNLFNFF